MDPILVPAPPRSSYNQNRRVSDLLFSQLKHFQHVVQKHGALGIPADLERDLYTEAWRRSLHRCRNRGSSRHGLPAAC